MTTTSFNDGWTVGPHTGLFSKLSGGEEKTPVTLPHDALISTARAPEHRGKGGYFPSAAFQYTKDFVAPEEWRGKHVRLHFDGAYRDAMVYVNGALAANRAGGYTPFDAVLDPYLRFGESNSVRVHVRTHDDSRWYAGAGLYRDVRLEVREPVHIRPGHLHVSTPVIDDDLAVVEFAFPVDNLTGETRTLDVRVALTAPGGGVAAEAIEPVTVLARSSAPVRMRLYVDAPQRWSVDTPQLYAAAIQLHDGATELDAADLRVGLRSLRLDPRHGLRVNGDLLKLRGACIHHDNGPLGAAAFADAEARKIRLLKEAGFNAVRSAHNPMSEAMLDACDELGMIVMDEAFDIWTVQKSSFDYSVSFPDWWERDLEAMVRRDRNHASVLFYSIGNEIPETGDEFGANLGRRLAETVRGLDPDRFVTNGINGFVSVMDDLLRLKASGGLPASGVNDAMADPAGTERMNQLNRSSLVTEKTAESFAVLDVAGMNYGDARYDLDAEAIPRRIIVGTETFPTRIASNWPLVQKHPQVIGDFTWTGWDYLGEAGIGRPKYAGEALDHEAPYPWLTAWCGDIDITGHRLPASYFREIVFGLRSDPYIAVRNPETAKLTQLTDAWAWSDSQSSWTWDTPEGTRTVVEVYSADDEVELLFDGRSLGSRPAGPAHGFTALFDVEYHPGELVAIGRSAGRETGRCALSSRKGDALLTVRPERKSVPLGPGSLLYVPVEIVDEKGTLLTTDEPAVTVSLDGPAVLQALGSARPDNEEPFSLPTHHAFRGRLLAVLRPTGTGTVSVVATAEGGASAEAHIDVTDETPRRSADA
ncbi:glycoside hydrolase family 2 TIM barrel-domain containing protein [Streptomyces fractus]|uniref:glycoside hydrolase family 2 TIM barrel-domain containing protein n=1 Tax=Streptomyces fractus TaxID=641806 RepID=UPI003CEAD8C5